MSLHALTQQQPRLRRANHNRKRSRYYQEAQLPTNAGHPAHQGATAEQNRSQRRKHRGMCTPRA
jgi:hypothetical protein